ncbi:hypothetical protein E4T38_01630 [Aureobasidium subglaciale]|nr:hypothetical protein E4T38_01630 [Aureobasidium subglaciale]KAI5222549.1 hypothetical protein E4T40_04847 [Aureobasidium subglaciale]KAI5233059.1 hypothetical protein E4T41_01628 [Aureobasidium subglaciale]KAI5262296.1 hypothetical protein E4T46_04559 [Aureobasidium subglaciale]
MPIMQNAQPFFHHVAFYLRECSLRPSISLINTRAFSACPIWKEAQEDPDLQRQHRLEQRAARKRHLYATSRAVREQSQLARHKHHMMRYRADPDYRVTKRARSREHIEAKRREPFHDICLYLNRWINAMPAIRESLTWPNHRPSWSEEPVERYCANCDRERLGGIRPSQDHEDQYDCSKCILRDPAKALPVGYEDVKTAPELSARRKMLKGTTKK